MIRKTHNRKPTIFSIFVVLGLTLLACPTQCRHLRNEAGENNKRKKKSLNDFVANQSNLRFFEAALLATRWADELEGNKLHTLFAPCDKFFDNEDQECLKEKLKKPMYKAHLHALVAAQLFEGKVSPTDMTSDLSDTQIEMMDHKCKTACAKSAAGAMRINGYNRVLDSSECSNGYAYVTERFIEPPFWFRTLWDVVQFDLDETASDFASLVIQEGMQSILMDEDADYTLFVPTNDALSPMIASGSPGLYKSWKDLILNHLVPAKVQATKFMKAGEKATLVTMHGTEVDMGLSNRGTRYTVTCADHCMDFTAAITERDHLACNGVAHVINAVLKPSS